MPAEVGKAVSSLWEKRSQEPEAVLSHSGGREVVKVVEEMVGRGLPETRAVLSKYGNCSSPSVMMALAESLATGESKYSYWLTAFGAGFSAHSCELSQVE